MTIVILLLLAGMFLASAQYDLETDTGYACWQCPVCGYVVSLTPAEAASINPYTLCPSCNSAYAGNFIPVSCQSTPGYDTYGYTSQGYNQQEMEDENVMNLQEGGNYASSGKGKILMVLSPQEYQEEELNVPREYFQSRGYSVILASKGVKTATGMSGESVDVDLDLKSVKLSDYVAVVFVGGEGIYSLKLNEDPDYQALAKSASAQKKLVGAICLGPWILADAGLLKGKMATASETDHIKSKGAIVSDEAVVRDGNIITGNGPYASQKFAEAVIAALETSGSAGSIGGGSDQTDFPQMDGSLTRNSGSAASDTRAASSESSQAAKWRCTVCGYIYDPAENDGVPFEKLPSSWKCPCGAPKSKFVKV